MIPTINFDFSKTLFTACSARLKLQLRFGPFRAETCGIRITNVGMNVRTKNQAHIPHPAQSQRQSRAITGM